MTSTIQIRTNLFLWLLTGRSEGFFSPALNSGVVYSTTAKDPAVASARSLLRLDDVRSDFYVLGALAAAYLSMPLLRGLPEERGLAFVEDLVQMPPMDVTGNAMRPLAGNSWPSLDGRPAGSEGFTRVTITRSDSLARIERDDGYSKLVAYRTVGDTLVIPGIEVHGINAAFSSTEWLAGQPIVVRLAPARYPFAAMARSISDNSSAIALMSGEGLMEAYATATDDLRRVGVLAAAIMRRVARSLSAEQTSVAISVVDTDDELIDISSSYQLYFRGASLLYDGANIQFDG